MDLYFLIPGIVTKTFNRIAELAIATGKPTNEASAEIEAQSLTAETKTITCSK